MKAKLKKTGEVINIAEYDRVKLDVCDSYGNPIEVDYNDIEKFYDDNGIPLGMPTTFNPVLEVKDDIDFEHRRYEIAKAVVQGQYSNKDMMLFVGRTSDYPEKILAELAVRQANALIEELKKNKQL